MINKREDFLSDQFALAYVRGQRIKRNKSTEDGQPPHARPRGKIMHSEMRANKLLLRHGEEDNFFTFRNLEGSLNAYERDLLGKFIIHMGPESVRKHARVRREENEDPDFSPFSRALGISFERLAAISLTEFISGVNSGKENAKKLFLLDPGSASRVFRHIHDKIGVIPDGAIIHVNSNGSIILKHLVEYKLNPQARQSELEVQIAKMLGFLEEYKGQVIKTPLIKFDTQKGISSNRIHIDGAAGMFLIFPNDKQGIKISNNKVFQIPTPFDTRFVREVAHASLLSEINNNG
jgi:hypothetical protein